MGYQYIPKRKMKIKNNNMKYRQGSGTTGILMHRLEYKTVVSLENTLANLS